jgi:hypothetical protein
LVGRFGEKIARFNSDTLDVKIVSPFLKDAFYKTEYIPQAVESIQMNDVLKAISVFKTI